jgi:TusA-related sulfurtransferase
VSSKLTHKHPHGKNFNFQKNLAPALQDSSARKFQNENTIREWPMETFDSRNAITPLFLLQVTNAFRKMKPGDKLEIIADDASIASDLKSILASRGHELKVVESVDETSNDLRMWLIKTTT